MFTVYDMEVFPNDWMIVFMDTETGQVERIHNDKERLTTALYSKKILVGYNNYRYDDLVLAGLLNGTNPYEISKRIFEGKRISLRLNLITLDVMQEVRQGLSLKEAQANMGLSIVEMPVDFEKKILTDEEIEQVFHYCENDVKTTAKLFEEREAYFTSKFDMVQTFKLRPTDLKKTRANLSAAILRARKVSDTKNDRLLLDYDKRLKLHELPNEIKKFYEGITTDYKNGTSHEELERKSLVYKLAGLDHTFGFGGLHAAKENYIGEGNFLQIDATSFYPSLMINNDFISRASDKPELFKKIYDQRLKLKIKKDLKEEVFKIVLNSTYGAFKSIYNNLYDPLQANNIVVNGQLIWTHLILLLEPFCELIQSNTDAIIIKYDDGMERMIKSVLDLFEKQYKLNFDVERIKRIAQRDVNNYSVMLQDGTIKAVGRMSNHDGGDWERNNLSIIDMALTEFYMNDIPIQTTVIDTWKGNDLLPFQLVAKAGSFDGMTHERLVNERIGMVDLQKVNRIFATKNGRYGKVYKVRDGKHHKIPNSPDSAMIWNEDISQLNRRSIDLNWYVRLINNQLF